MSSFFSSDSVDLHVWLYNIGLRETSYMFNEYGLMAKNGKWFNDGKRKKLK